MPARNGSNGCGVIRRGTVGQRTDLSQAAERHVAKHRHSEECFDQRIDHVGFEDVTQWNPAEKAQQCFQRYQKQGWMA